MKERLGSALGRSGVRCAALALVSLSGCCVFHSYETPADIEHWQDTTPPRLNLAEKAARYQQGIEERHQLARGIIRYRTFLGEDGPESAPGNLADGCFYQGLYLASQALRYAATGDAAAREQVLLSLEAMKLYVEVAGKRGLLARYVALERPDDERWRPSPTQPLYFWRSDASKDQYAGYVHGLGVALAVLEDAEIRARIAPLAAAIADHLIENDLRIIDWDGEETTFGDLRGRIFGFPFGIDALICLAIAKVAAESTREEKYIRFHEELVADGYPGLSGWVHWIFFGTKRVNDHMAYLALYPLFLLEVDPAVKNEYVNGERATWSYVKDEYNGFFSFVHALSSVGGSTTPPEEGERAAQRGRTEGREALFLFPDDKVAWSVDLSRPGFDFPRAAFTDEQCRPKSSQAIPPYLRRRSSSLWVSDPYRLVGGLGREGNLEYAGIDYLLAYWMGRYHGFVAPEE